MMAQDGAVPMDVDLFASDLCSAALDKAQSGLYTHFEVQRGLPIRSLLQHFEPADDAWRISDKLRSMVRWRRLNLVDQFSVGTPFDLILCRNVVDSFDTASRTKTLERLETALAPDGWLLLGINEPAPPGFVTVGAAGLCRRKLSVVEAA